MYYTRVGFQQKASKLKKCRGHIQTVNENRLRTNGLSFWMTRKPSILTWCVKVKKRKSNLASFFRIRNQAHLHPSCIVHPYTCCLMHRDGSFLIPAQVKLKRGFQIRFLPVFQRVVGSQSKLCFRASKSSLGLKFKGGFKGKNKTFIQRYQANVCNVRWFGLSFTPPLVPPMSNVRKQKRRFYKPSNKNRPSVFKTKSTVWFFCRAFLPERGHKR